MKLDIDINEMKNICINDVYTYRNGVGQIPQIQM